MRIKLIACKVMARELSFLASQSENFIDITWLRQGLHNEPERLRSTLQSVISQIDSDEHLGSCQREAGGFDAIVLGYGLCSNGVVGLSSMRYPLVIPRAHDCITLFLGSRERYRRLFDSYDGGIFWYTDGWMENSIMPGEEQRQKLYEQYAKQYGEENAGYLLQMNEGWYREYRMAMYLYHTGGLTPRGRDKVKAAAGFLGWEYGEQPQSDNLFRAMLSGEWDEKDFLILPPGAQVAASYEDGILTARGE